MGVRVRGKRGLIVPDATASAGQTPGTSGAVPAPPAAPGTTKFLREDMSYAVPSGTGVPTTRQVATTAPITGGGDLSADRTIAISPASGAAAGSMSSADFAKIAAAFSSAFTGTASTTDATVTTCGSFTPQDLSTVTVQVTVSAHRDDHSQGAGYILAASFRRSGGVVTQIGVTTVVVANEDDVSWGATLDINSTSVRVRVTGAAATNINWRACATVVGVQ